MENASVEQVSRPAAAPCAGPEPQAPRIHVGLLVTGGDDLNPEVYRLLWHGLGNLPDIEVGPGHWDSPVLVNVNVLTAANSAGELCVVSLHATVTEPAPDPLRDYHLGQYSFLGGRGKLEEMCTTLVTAFDARVGEDFRRRIR